MRAVVDTSSLIFLAKLGQLGLLNELFSEVFVPREVAVEALRGAERAHKDALLIKAKLENGELKRKAPREKSKGAEKLGLHTGELAVLLLARELKGSIVVADDYAAIKAAKYLGLKPYSTPFILLKALKSRRLTFKEFHSSIDRLVELGYFISPKLYIMLLEKAKES